MSNGIASFHDRCLPAGPDVFKSENVKISDQIPVRKATFRPVPESGWMHLFGLSGGIVRHYSRPFEIICLLYEPAP